MDKTSRDDFKKATKDALAARAGHHCAFPDCTNITHGPSEESNRSVSSTGMACHISSASAGPGAKRYDPSITAEQRCSINNGIWMCYTHGKLIDTDELRYSTSTLKQWKEIAERKAQIRQAYGEKAVIRTDALREIGLPGEVLMLSDIGEENHKIGCLIQDARVGELWGDEVAHAIRDLSIELVRNAFEHGGATQFRIEIQEKSIELYDNGTDYNLWDLYRESGNSGGIIAAKHLVDCFKFRLLAVSDHFRKRNRTAFSLIDDASEVHDLTECSIDINWNQLENRELPYQLHELCRSKCIVLPPFFCLSDSALLREIIPIDDGRPIIFILTATSPKAQEVLESRFPGCLTIRLLNCL